MTKNVLDGSDGPLTVDILVNGSITSDRHELLEMRVEHQVNRIPIAHVTLADGSVKEGQFVLSASRDFAQGKEIEIRLGRGCETTTVFKGLIVSRRISTAEAGESSLVLVCRDKAIRTTQRQTEALFQDALDSDVIAALLSDAGIENDVEATTVHNRHQVTGDTSDWDFILRRSAANGQVVIVRDGKVSVATPTIGDPGLAVRYGDSIIRMDLEEEALMQVDGQGPATVRPSIFGTVAFPGNAGAGPGDAIELKGLGGHFDGSSYVRAVRHVVADGAWTTEVELGLSRQVPDDERPVARPQPAHGSTPGIGALQIAQVINTNAGSGDQSQVEVSMPQLSDEAGGVWVQNASPYATDSAGIEFMPEVGDTVVVGFLNGDLNTGVILGSLHSSSSPSPLAPNEQDAVKAIVSRSQLKIAFDDENRTLTIETPDGRRVTLSDDDQLVEVTDGTGNRLGMNAAGMALSSPGDIAIQAGGTVSIEARSGIHISTAADTQVEGANVSITANVGLTAEGGASAELSAGGQTTVKGAMVMIN